MRIQDDTICKFCQGVFCCVECCHKHELKNHVDSSKADFSTTFFLCPICEKRPLILKSELPNEIISHIELHHLPLRCNKCFKTYNNVNDLKEFSNCMFQNHASSVSNQSCYSDHASKVTVTKVAEVPQCIISQSSPLTRQDFNESHMTPISIINMRWKAKSKLTQEEFISDSVSSIKNISSISNSSISRNTETSSTVKGKVTRCSSTPVQLEMVFAKPKEQTFNASGGHMSSIQYNSGCESDISPAIPQPNSQALETVNRYMKVAGSRPRMSAVTPLRQVMSKSIQKAFAEHGLPSSNSLRSSNTLQRKQILYNTSSPEVNANQSPLHTALDLRLSPAVRRSKSKSEVPLKNRISNEQRMEYNKFPNLRHEILLSAKKLTTESIVITRTEHLSSISSSTSAVSSNYSISSVKPTLTNSTYKSAESNRTGSSVFKSCSSVEIITATTEQIKHLKKSFDEENVTNTEIPPLTPITRIPGSVIHKKIIKFETPKIELCDSHEFENSTSDRFFTPDATPIHNNIENDLVETKRGKLLVKQNLNGRFSPQRRPSIKESEQNTTFNRVVNVRNTLDDKLGIDDEDDGVFLSQQPGTSSQTLKDDKKENQIQQSSGLWSLMSSVMRLPSFKGINSDDSNSNSIIRRCASIAGSLVRSKSLVDENELSSLKRKRTYTIDNQASSAYFADLNNVVASTSTSPISNNSSKRFRIQGRRPIDRMRLNS